MNFHENHTFDVISMKMKFQTKENMLLIDYRLHRFSNEITELINCFSIEKVDALLQVLNLSLCKNISWKTFMHPFNNAFNVQSNIPFDGKSAELIVQNQLLRFHCSLAFDFLEGKIEANTSFANTL